MSQNIIAGGVGAVLGLLLSQGFQQVRAETDRNGDTIINGFSPDGKPFNVQLKNNAVISPQYDFVRVTSSALVKPDENTPSYELKNASGVIKRIFSISIVPDSNFKTDGVLAISINETTFFPITNLNAGDFQDVDSITIPIPDTYGLKILPKEKLKLFIWSPTGALVGVTISVFIGELP